MTASQPVRVGGFAVYQGRYDLSHPVTHSGAFAGTLLQMIAMAVSVAAGLVALAVRTRRSSAAAAG